MAELTTTASAALVTGATSAAAAGRPPEEVIVWALLGSMVAVWLDAQKGEQLSIVWALRMLGLIAVSVLSGIAGSALLQGIPEVPIIGSAAKMERWVSAFAIAALIHKAGPLAYRIALGWTKKGEGKDVARP